LCPGFRAGVLLRVSLDELFRELLDGVALAIGCSLLGFLLGIELQDRRIIAARQLLQRLGRRRPCLCQREATVERELAGTSLKPIADGPGLSTGRMHEQVEPPASPVWNLPRLRERLHVLYGLRC